MNLRPLHLPFVILISSFGLSLAAPPPELTVLRQQYEKALDTTISGPFQQSISALNAKYTGGLDRAIAEAKAAGKLQDILAIEAEKKRIAQATPIPSEDDESTPAALKTLRGIYREQWAKIEETRATSQLPMLTAPVERLKTLETTLTKGDRVDEAKEVLAYREGLALLQGAAVVPVATATTGSTPDAVKSAAAAKTNYPKGDDRKAAEWVLGAGGSVTLAVDRKEVVVDDAQSLPRDKFELRKVFLKFFAGKQPATPITDLLPLAGLQSLVELNTAGLKSLADEHLAVLASLPALKLAYFNAGNLTDAAFAHLAAAPQLSIIHFSDQPRVTGTGLASLARLDTLVFLNIQSCGGLSEEGFAALALLKQLQVLFVDSTPFRDAHLPLLDGMKELRDLQVKGCQVTLEGIASRKALAGLKVRAISLRAGESVSQAGLLAKACPALANLIITGRTSSVPLTAEDTAPLGVLPKLRELKLYSPAIGAAAVAGISGMPDLQVLRFGYLKFTDECLPPMLSHKSLREIEFGEAQISDTGLLSLVQMKSLKQLKLKGCPQLTPAGVDAFKKKRPDVKVE